MNKTTVTEMSYFVHDYPMSEYACDEWERQYCCELCRYYGGGDEMECAHCDPMNI